MKFKFADNVKITHGFYEGCIGIVTKIQENGENQWDEYYVKGSKLVDGFCLEFTSYIRENEMEKS